MELRIYTVRDSKGEIYNQPFFKKTQAEAERDFLTLSNDPKSILSQYPEDFDLYYLGMYDDQTGVISPLDAPKHIARARRRENHTSNGL